MEAEDRLAALAVSLACRSEMDLFGLSLIESTDLFLEVSEEWLVGILRYFSKILLIEEWSFGDIFSLRTLFARLLSNGSDLRLIAFSVDFIGVLKDSPSWLGDDLEAALKVSSIFSKTLSAISSNPMDVRLDEPFSTVSEDRLAGIETAGAEARLSPSKDWSGV